MEKVGITVLVPVALRNKVKRQARKLDMSVTGYIKMLIRMAK